MAEPTEKPADAYYEIANWLGDKFFVTPPPPSGRVVVIYGRDKVDTTWYLPLSRSVALCDFARSMPGLAVKSSADYVDSGRVA